MQLLSTWIQTLSAPVFYVFRTLHGWTGSIVLALFLLALLMESIEIVLKVIAPGRWFALKKHRDEEALEARRTSLDPDEFARQKALLDARKNPKWRVWSSLFILLLCPVLQWYSVFALYVGLVNSVDLRGKPFAWTPDITSRDPRHILTIVAAALLLLGLLSGLVKLLSRSAEPGPRFSQLRSAFVLVLIAEFTPLAIPTYAILLFVAGKVLPYLLMLAAIPVLAVYSRLFRKR